MFDMTRDTRSTTELTPLGQLEEGGIHDLLGYQLAQASILTTAAFQATVGKPLDLRKVEFTILQLVQQNAPVTATKLAKALAVTTPGVTIWLDKLEERGLLVRERGDVDRRTQNLSITRKGQTLVAAALEQLRQTDSEILSHLSAGERHLLLELLQKVARLRKR